MRKIASEARHGHQPGQALALRVALPRSDGFPAGKFEIDPESVRGRPLKARNWNNAMPGSKKA
jgi:hypothetical protein